MWMEAMNEAMNESYSILRLEADIPPAYSGCMNNK